MKMFYKASSLIMNKCRYYNDSQTACTLMIDDLAGVAITEDGILRPGNDWGYGLDSPDSLWYYFEQNFLNRFPEVKGSIFFASQTYRKQNANSGYMILNREIDNPFKKFINKVKQKFEIAFHGTTHGKYIDPDSPELINNYIQEFDYVAPDDIPTLKTEIKRIEDLLETDFNGGKYCGYRKNEHADKVIEQLGFKWWASSADMINKKHPCNKHSYFGINKKLLNFPTNISGNFFNRRLKKSESNYSLLHLLKAPLNHFIKERYIQYLYENGFIISIQEHFQNQRTDGNRQTPNIYDDIFSLTQIFSLLKGTATWYATCSEIAHYLESYDNSEIVKQDTNTFSINYKGRWDNAFLSIKAPTPRLLYLNLGKELQGVYKNGGWVFNNIAPGKYRII